MTKKTPEQASKELGGHFSTICPVCDNKYDDHNYHDDVNCLDILNNVAVILRDARDGY